MDLTCLLLCSLYYSDIHFIPISWYAWIKCNEGAIPYSYRDIIVIKSYEPTNIVIQIFLYRGNWCLILHCASNLILFVTLKGTLIRMTSY